MSIKIKSVASHRNGSAGNGFYVVLFREGRGKTASDKVAVVFADRRKIAVLDVKLLAAGNVNFGENSWDGPEYEDDCRKAVLEYEIGRVRGDALHPGLDAEEIRDLTYGKHEHVGGGHGISGTREGVCVICGECLHCGRSEVWNLMMMHKKPDGTLCKGEVVAKGGAA